MTRIDVPAGGICILVILSTLGCTSVPPVKRLSNWRVFELHEELSGSYEQSWHATVEAISDHWSIEIANASTGFFRTRWAYDHRGDYRGRLIAILKRSQESPCRIELQTEVQTCRDDSDGEGGRSGWRPVPGSAFNRDVYVILAHQLGQTALYGIEQPVIRRLVIR